MNLRGTERRRWDFPANNYCDYAPQALPRSRPCRASQGHKPTRRRPVPHRCPVSACRLERHRHTSDWSMVVGTAWHAIRHRESAWRREQSGHRGRRERGAGRLYASQPQFGERHQRDDVRETQFRFHPRHHTAQSLVRFPYVLEVNPSVPIRSVPEPIDRVRQSQSGQARASRRPAQERPRI